MTVLDPIHTLGFANCDVELLRMIIIITFVDTRQYISQDGHEYAIDCSYTTV